jgi:ceramide glucosyltransferase
MQHGSIIAITPLLIVCFSALWFYCYSIYSAIDFFTSSRQIDADFHPPLSILKPLKGVDSFAYENLASFCSQDYPAYQVIFGAIDSRDPGLEVARRLVADFPALDIRIVADEAVIGANLKVSNLANMLGEATYPLLLISDSDIRVGPDYLCRVVQPMRDARVGVVTCLYRSIARGFVAMFEALGVSTDFHAGVLVARKMEGMRFALGATVLIRRAALDAFGGFKAVADYIADDYLLGNLTARAGYSVVLSDYVVEHVVDPESFLSFVHHQVRWGRSTRSARPWSYAGLIFTHGVVSSLLLLLVCRGSIYGWIVLGSTWFVRLAMGWVVGCKYLKDPSATKLLWLAPLRDTMSFLVWVWCLIGRTIEWRGNRFKVMRGGRMVPVNAECGARNAE